MSHSPFTDALLQPKINSERSITLPYDPHRVNAELINVQAGDGGGAVSQRGFDKRVGRWELNQKQPYKEMQNSNQTNREQQICSKGCRFVFKQC